MENNEQVILTRDCEAILIPYGDKVTLRKGDEGTITQDLGGSYTLLIRGSLLRIDGKDADAIGKELISEKEVDDKIAAIAAKLDRETDHPEVKDKLVWEALKTCYDPEIPENVVDLGLIYSSKLTPNENGGTNVEIKMPLTAPGCGLGDVLADDARQKISQVPGISDVTVELVWDPPWDRSMISEAASLQLGMM